MLLGHRKLAHQRARIQIQPHALEDRLGLLVQCLFVKKQSEAATRFAADEYILGCSQVIHQVEFLVNDADAQHLCGTRRRNLNRPPFDADFTAVLRIHARQYLHQRRFSGAVFTHERVDFTAPQIEPAVVERQHAGETLGDIFQGNNGFRCRGRRRVSCVSLPVASGIF